MAAVTVPGACAFRESPSSTDVDIAFHGRTGEGLHRGHARGISLFSREVSG